MEWPACSRRLLDRAGRDEIWAWFSSLSLVNPSDRPVKLGAGCAIRGGLGDVLTSDFLFRIAHLSGC